MSLFKWASENFELLVGITTGAGTPLSIWVTWSIKRWLDGRYERRRAQTAEARKQRIDELAREVFASPILHEYTRSTVTATLQSGEHAQAVETLVANSIPIQRIIDARVAHGWNNQQYDLHKIIREMLAESNAPILEAIKELSKALVDIQISCAGHKP